MEFKKFSEAYDTGKPFYQLCYYDRRETYSGYRTCRNFSSREEVEEVIREMEEENKKLFQRMLETYKDYGVTEDNFLDDNLWNRMKIDYKSLSDIDNHLFRFGKNRVGYCYIDVHERDKVREEREEKEYWEEREAEGDFDGEGPYGGAFASERDFINWKEGPGFLSD